jgi:hypothetical protein
MGADMALLAHTSTLALAAAHPLARAGARSTTGGGLSGAAIAAAAIGGLAAALCLAWGVSRMLTLEPRWTLSLRHSMAEAGFRASATWAEFGDWMRLGR